MFVSLSCAFIPRSNEVTDLSAGAVGLGQVSRQRLVNCQQARIWVDGTGVSNPVTKKGGL